jgi:hypothetical protein
MSNSSPAPNARSFGLQARLMRGLNDPSMSFIQKPFTAENLAMQVRKVLDAA